jgi:hypothetical protein
MSKNHKGLLAVIQKGTLVCAAVRGALNWFDPSRAHHSILAATRFLVRQRFQREVL